MDPDLVAKVHTLHPQGKENIIAILMFGSRASGTASAGSDIDLLVICRTPQESRVVDMGSETLDMICVTPNQLRKRLNRPHPDNNNFILNILSEARILYDETGLAADFRRNAMATFAAGPPPMTPAERVVAARSLKKMLAVLLRRATIRCTSAEERLVVRMRLDEIVMKSVYAFMKAQKRWTNSWPIVVRELNYMPDLSQHWQCYVAASNNLEEQLACGTKLIHIICGEIENNGLSG